MQSDRYSPNDGTLTNCTWCGSALQQSIDGGKAPLFCSHRCQVEANFWLYQELCVVEITRPRHFLSDDDYESP